jgi:hypothetical protein
MLLGFSFSMICIPHNSASTSKLKCQGDSDIHPTHNSNYLISFSCRSDGWGALGRTQIIQVPYAWTNRNSHSVSWERSRGALTPVIRARLTYRALPTILCPENGTRLRALHFRRDTASIRNSICAYAGFMTQLQ